MDKFFPMVITGLFCAASAVYFCVGQPAKGMFYLLSALINLNVLFLK